MARPATRPLDLVRSVVMNVSRRFPSHIDRDELIGAGGLGYAKAQLKYDSALGAFESYATQCIKSAVLDSLRKGPGQRYHYKKEGMQKLPFIVAMDRLPEPAIELDLVETLQLRKMLEKLSAALLQLDARQRFVLERRFYDEAMTEEIGREMGVNASRVCQITSEALKKLRDLIADSDGD